MATKGEILYLAERNLDKLGDELGKKLGIQLDSGGEVDASKLKNVKKNFVVSGTLDTIPDKIYKKIARQ